jgi:hypothetical protein
MLAHARLEDALALRELAVGGDTLMIVDESGTIPFTTDRAQQVLRSYFPAVKQDLPPELRKWMKTKPQVGGQLSRQRVGGRYLSLAKIWSEFGLSHAASNRRIQTENLR